jgi:hypothetical protein
MIIEMKYRITIAITGVISNTPSLGTILRKGERIGSVMSSSITGRILFLLKLNHDSITRAKTT